MCSLCASWDCLCSPGIPWMMPFELAVVWALAVGLVITHQCRAGVIALVLNAL